MRKRRDLANVRIDHHRTNASEIHRLEQVFGNVTLSPFAIQLQEDLVVRLEIVPEPVAGAHEATDLHARLVSELLFEEAGAAAAGCIESLFARRVPEAELADFDSVIADCLERRPAGACGLEAVDAIEAVLRIANRVKRAPIVGADVQKDLHGSSR